MFTVFDRNAFSAFFTDVQSVRFLGSALKKITFSHNEILLATQRKEVLTSNHRVPTFTPPPPLREGSHVEIIWTRKLPPPPQGDRPAIQLNHIKFSTYSALASEWTPSINERVAIKKPTIVLSDLRCLPNPSVTRHKIQIKFVELNWINECAELTHGALYS